MNQYELVLKQIKEVTHADTTRVAQEVLSAENYIVVLVGDDQFIKSRVGEIENADVIYVNESGENGKSMTYFQSQHFIARSNQPGRAFHLSKCA